MNILERLIIVRYAQTDYSSLPTNFLRHLDKRVERIIVKIHGISRHHDESSAQTFYQHFFDVMIPYPRFSAFGRFLVETPLLAACIASISVLISLLAAAL